MDRLEGYYSIRSTGAVPEGKRDCTQAIQEAIDKAAELGGNVYVPPGKYLLKGGIHVRPGVTVCGLHNAPSGHGRLTGSVLLATGGRGDAGGKPLFFLDEGAIVRALTVYYPEQELDSIQPYPWTFQLDGVNAVLENITLINSYQGIRVGPAPNALHRIRNVHGCVLNRGILVDSCCDVGWIENVDFDTLWWSQSSLNGNTKKATAYTQEHLEAFTFGRADSECVTDASVANAKIGFRFVSTENGHFGGRLAACRAHNTHTAIHVDHIQPTGVVITGGEFTNTQGNSSCQVRVTRKCVQGSLRIVNAAFHGQSNHMVELDGSGFVSFSDCCFVDDKKKGGALIVAHRGRFQLHHSSFDTQRTCVELGENVEHAIISGNNGCNGFSCVCHTPEENVIVTANEPQLTGE